MHSYLGTRVTGSNRIVFSVFPFSYFLLYIHTSSILTLTCTYENFKLLCYPFFSLSPKEIHNLLFIQNTLHR